MAEFEIGGVQYRSGRLDAFRQFHIARRLAPLIGKLGALGPMLDGLKAPAGGEGAGLTAMLEPLAEAIASLSDADTEYVLGSCLSVVQRQQGTVWMAAWNAAAKRPQFDDITLPAMLQIVLRVLTAELQGFFPVAPQS